MPGKIHSKRQFRFLKAVEAGAVRAPGLSKAKAHEMTEAESSSTLRNLPESKGGRRKMRSKLDGYKRRKK
jgi:hypothetical protein